MHRLEHVSPTFTALGVAGFFTTLPDEAFSIVRVIDEVLYSTAKLLIMISPEVVVAIINITFPLCTD